MVGAYELSTPMVDHVEVVVVVAAVAAATEVVAVVVDVATTEIGPGQ